MRLSIHILLLDRVPIAGLITGAFQRGLYALHIVYDNSLSRLGSGSAILMMGMRQAIDGRYAFFNLLSGFGYYKVRWQAQMTKTRYVRFYKIGSAFFWRRVFGDLKRLLFPASIQPETVLFNPLRREATDQDGEPVQEAMSRPRLSFPDQEKITGLLSQIRKSPGEFLSSVQLAEAMPFTTQRPARKTNETAGSALPPILSVACDAKNPVRSELKCV